jgi:hypothetical protein
MFNVSEGIFSFLGSVFSGPSSDPATHASSSFDANGGDIVRSSDDSGLQSNRANSSDDQSSFGAWGTASNQIAASEASSLFPTQSVTTETWGSIDSSFSSSPIDF